MGLGDRISKENPVHLTATQKAAGWAVLEGKRCPRILYGLRTVPGSGSVQAVRVVLKNGQVVQAAHQPENMKEIAIQQVIDLLQSEAAAGAAEEP